jgi:NitT/TauT family transport system permease protein
MKSNKLDQLLLVVAICAVWQLLYLAAGPNVISSPTDTLTRAVELLRTSAFWDNAASTGAAFGMAGVLSIAGGTVVGLWLGLRQFAGDVADPILGALYSLPKITLYPIILLIFGLGISAKVAFGAIHGFFPVAIFTMNAARNVSPVYYRTARIMRLSPAVTVATVLAPAALPEIFAGIRIGLALTLLGTLIGELFASTSGLGFALIRATDIHAVPDITAITFLIFVFAAAVNGLLHAIERRIFHNG